jgi:hypothetical protein
LTGWRGVMVAWYCSSRARVRRVWRAVIIHMKRDKNSSHSHSFLIYFGSFAPMAHPVFYIGQLRPVGTPPDGAADGGSEDDAATPIVSGMVVPRLVPCELLRDGPPQSTPVARSMPATHALCTVLRRL